MIAVRYRYVLVMGVCVIAALVSAQITFSRDWTGGKRGTSQLDLDCTQFTKICRHFIHEIKRAVISEISAKRHKQKQEYEEDKSFVYDEE